jgi:hypothetical protein
MVSDMRAWTLLLSACIVPPSGVTETGLEPDVDADGDADSDTDGDGDSDTDTGASEPWNVTAISFDFAGAIVGGELVDGAILAGKRHDASFGLSLMSTDANDLRNCNLRYRVAGAPVSMEDPEFSGYWRSWDISGVEVDETTGDCDSIASIFRDHRVDDPLELEAVVASLDIHMGLEDIGSVWSGTLEEWAQHWGSGSWKEDVPYLAAGALYLAEFGAAFEMNVFQAYAIDPVTLAVEGDGTNLVPLELEGAPDAPDGFYTSSPMYIIGTSW